MRTIAAVLCVGFVVACSDDPGSSNSSDDGSTSATASMGSGGSPNGAGGASSGPSSGPSSGTGAGQPSNGAELVYDGPVGGQLDGWDPLAPWPMVAMGELGGDWVTTLLRIGDDGTLSENVAARVVLWRFQGGTSQLYDGPVGGQLPAWDPQSPTPLVAVAHANGSWVLTLLRVASDGTLLDNVADRVIVWSVDDAAIRYDGQVGMQLAGWTGAPEPLVAGGALGPQDWWMTLFRVAPDGTTSENVSTRLVIWGVTSP